MSTYTENDFFDDNIGENSKKKLKDRNQRFWVLYSHTLSQKLKKKISVIGFTLRGFDIYLVLKFTVKKIYFSWKIDD